MEYELTYESLEKNPKRRFKKKDEEKEKNFKWKRFFGLAITFIAGILMTIRVVIDGKVSFYGVLVSLISKMVAVIIFAFDPLLEWDAKVSYGLPKLFGIITGIITIVGIIINDSEFYRNL